MLVSDGDPWVMYRVFLAGLLYMYIPDTWRVLCISYVTSSLCFILSLGIVPMRGSAVHHLFLYPVAVMIGVFVSRAVAETPSEEPTLHILSVLPWVCLGFYGPLGYAFAIPYIIPLLIARMYRWAVVSVVSMALNSALIPLHSPFVSLVVPVIVLLGYSRFADIYHDTPLEVEV